MQKLWQNKSADTDDYKKSKIDSFTIGNDPHWDLCLASADIKGSLAHAMMLESIGLLTVEELKKISSGLEKIRFSIAEGSFVIEDGVEDIHSQIEILLTRELGDVGKKIHSGRSRNDQAVTDIKLYLKEEIINISELIAQLFNQLIKLSNENAGALMPGYTHLQIAMPSSFGLWFGAYAESLCDDLELIIAAYNIVNRNPLGSGAGYGSSFPLDRQMTTNLLGFESMNYNSVYAQMTRGKSEKICAIALAGVAATLSRFSMDVCLYSGQNFGFVTIPSLYTTGSSIMPHKKNPDVFELIRAKCNKIQALPNELTMLINNLPGGYHRDLQLTKESLFPAIIELKHCIQLMSDMLEDFSINEDALGDNSYNLLFSVERVNELVLSGIPFRDAYHQVAELIRLDEFVRPATVQHTHEGSIGNLCNDRIVSRFEEKIKNILKAS